MESELVEVIVVGKSTSKLSIETHNNESFKLTPLSSDDNFNNIFRTRIDRELLHKPIQVIDSVADNSGGGGLLGFVKSFVGTTTQQVTTITLGTILQYNFIIDKKICDASPQEGVSQLMKYFVFHVLSLEEVVVGSDSHVLLEEISNNNEKKLCASTVWSIMQNLVQQNSSLIHGIKEQLKEELVTNQAINSTQLLILSTSCELFKPDNNLLQQLLRSQLSSQLVEQKHDQVFAKLKDLAIKTWASTGKFSVLPLCLYFPNEMKEIIKKKPIENSFEKNESYISILNTMNEQLEIKSKEFVLTVLLACPSIFDVVSTIDLFPEIELEGDGTFLKEIVGQKLKKMRIEIIPKLLLIPQSHILQEHLPDFIKLCILQAMIPQPASAIFQVFVSTNIFNKDDIFGFLSKHLVNSNFIYPHLVDNLENLPLDTNQMRKLFSSLSKPPELFLNILEKLNNLTSMANIDKVEDIESLKDVLWKTVVETSDDFFKLFEKQKQLFQSQIFEEFSVRYKKYIAKENKLFKDVIEKLFFVNNKQLFQQKFEFSYKLLKTCVLTMPSIKKPTRIDEVIQDSEIWKMLAKLDFKQIESCDLVVGFKTFLRDSYKNYFVYGKFSVEQTYKSTEKFRKLMPLYKTYLGTEFSEEVLIHFTTEISNTSKSFEFIRKLIIETGFHEGTVMIDSSIHTLSQTMVSDLKKLWSVFLPYKEKIISISLLHESTSFFTYISQETKLGSVLFNYNAKDWIESIINCEINFKKKWLDIVNGNATLGVIKKMYSFSSKKVELDLIEQYLNCKFNINAKSNLEFLENNLNFSEHAKQLVRLFDIFSIDGKFSSQLEEYIKYDLSDMCLFEFRKQTQELAKMITFTKFDIIEALSESKEVIDFIVENVNEDLRNMINGVEEHSDNFINESTVADLIDVWSFIRPVIVKVNKTETELLNILEKTYQSHTKYTNIHTKIACCSQQIYGLKRLHKNLSNRAELTRETVANLLGNGVALIYSASKLSSARGADIFQFKIIREKAEYLMDDLNDLKSRCLLLSSNEKREVGVASHNIFSVNYTSFINLVDKLQVIHQKLTELYLAGYPCPMNDQLLPYNILDDQIHKLEETYTSWIEIKKKTRNEFPILNSFHSQQVWLIENSIKLISTGGSNNIIIENEMKLLNILSIINPSITRLMIRETILNLYRSEMFVEKRMRVLGSILTHLSLQEEKSSKPTTTTTFIPNGTNIIAVDTKKIIPLVLTVFYGCEIIPTPLNTLICYNDTSMDEIDTFLARAKHFKTLHCIVNAHLLPFTVKDYLIDTIKNYQGKDYVLVIFTDKKNSITDELKKYIRDQKQFDDETLKTFIGTFRPHLEIVISHVSGIGKTEYINCSSFKVKKIPTTFPISGNLDRKKLVQRLSRTMLKPYSALHLDISIINNQSYDLLDYILFELLILGKLSCGSDIAVLPKLSIFVEVANTVNNTLVNSIALRNLLNVTDLSVDFNERFIVSTEPLSPIQVVCQYLNSLENNLLVTNDLELEKLKPLGKEECITLLRKYLTDEKLTSFSSVGVFLKVLATQLVILSTSLYFKVGSLKKMGADLAIRNELVLALVSVTTEYSSSIAALNKIHHLNTDEEVMLGYFNGCLHWEDSNHLLVLFHSMNNQTISAVYRDPLQVPQSITKLILSQKAFSSVKELPNFEKMPRKELLDTLKKICLTTPNDFDDEEYALTPDNILKMILIVTSVTGKIFAWVDLGKICRRKSFLDPTVNNFKVQKWCQVQQVPFAPPTTFFFVPPE